MINIGTLLAILRVQDSFTPVLKRAQASLKQTGARVKQVGEKMRSVGAGLTTGLTLPIVGMATAAGIAFGNFESNMNRVRALSGATGESFTQLETLARDLGKTTQFSASEAADAMGFLAMAGFDAAQITGSLPGVLQLAASAQLDLASAADITTNIMTGYGRSVEEVGATNDVLVKAFTSANTDLSQLGQAFKFVGPVAKAAGASFEETTASLALMGNAGIQASMAGTGLRKALSNLLGPTKKEQEVLDRLGVSVKDTNGKLLPMTDIVEQLETSGIDATDMLTLFGDRAGPAMQGLVSQGSDALRKLVRELEASGGTAERIARVQMEGLKGAFVKMKSATEGALISIGEGLAPALTKLMDVGIRVSNWVSNTLMPAFSNLSPRVQAIVIGSAAFAAALGPILAIAGTVTAAIGSLISSLGGAAGLLVGLKAVIAFISGPVGIVIALTALALSIKPVREFLWNLAQIIGNTLRVVIGGLINVVKAITVGFYNWFVQLGPVKAILETVGGVIGWLKGVAGSFAEGVADVAEKSSNWGKVVQEETIPAVETLSANIGDLAEIQIPNLTTETQATVEAQSDFIASLEEGSATAKKAETRLNSLNFATGRYAVTLEVAELKQLDQNAAYMLSAKSAETFTGQIGEGIKSMDELGLGVDSLSTLMSMELRKSFDETTASLVQLAQISGSGVFSGLLSGIASVMGGFQSALNGIDTFKTGFATMKTSAITGLLGMASGISAVIPIAQMAWKGIKKLFSFGGPSKTEIAGRKASDAFKEFATKILSSSGELEVNKLVAQGWARDLATQVVAVGEKYKELGLTQEQANMDVKATWDAIKDGPEAVNAAIDVIKGRMEGIGIAALQTSQDIDHAFRPRMVDVSFDVDIPDIDIPSITVPVSVSGNEGLPQFASGIDEVPGTGPIPAIVHGGERIVSVAQRKSEAEQFAGMRQELANIKRLLQDQPRALGVALSDANALG